MRQFAKIQRTEASPASALAAQGAILDLDGTLIREDRPLPGAARLLARFGPRCVIASNNSSDTAASLSRRLAAMGLEVPADRIVLAGEEALRLIARRHPGARVLLLGAPALHGAARALGLRPDRGGGEVALLCRDEAFDYAALRRLTDLVRAGAPFYVANPDLTHPGANGRPVPETGALLAALRACVGPSVRPEIIGKPGPRLFARSLELLGLPADQILVIGDNPATDIAGARAIGLRGLLIGAHPEAVAPDPAGLLGADGV